MRCILQANEELAVAEQELLKREMEIQRLEHELREQRIRWQSNRGGSIDEDDPRPFIGRTTVIAETLDIKKEEGILDVLFSIFSYGSVHPDLQQGDPRRRLLTV